MISDSLHYTTCSLEHENIGLSQHLSFPNLERYVREKMAALGKVIASMVKTVQGQ